jgi:hypothetical protein
MTLTVRLDPRTASYTAANEANAGSASRTSSGRM